MKEKDKMKKLMIAAAIVCATVAAQAATLKWGDDSLEYKDAAAGDNVKLNTIYFGTDATAKNAYEYIFALGADAGSKFIYDNYKDGTLAFTVSGSEGGKYDGEYSFPVQTADKAFDEGEAFGSTVKNITAGTDYYFASLIVAEDAKGDVEAFIGNVGDFEAGTANKTYNEMGRTWGGELGKGDVTWQSVPEPTSGLLLLLGVAGLALRRRRA